MAKLFGAALRTSMAGERLRVLRTIREQRTSVSGLAAILGRDRKAVSRGVKLLESLGLLKTHRESNPGHQRAKRKSRQECRDGRHECPRHVL